MAVVGFVGRFTRTLWWTLSCPTVPTDSGAGAALPTVTPLLPTAAGPEDSSDEEGFIEGASLNLPAGVADMLSPFLQRVIAELMA